MCLCVSAIDKSEVNDETKLWKTFKSEGVLILFNSVEFRKSKSTVVCQFRLFQNAQI